MSLFGAIWAADEGFGDRLMLVIILQTLEWMAKRTLSTVTEK